MGTEKETKDSNEACQLGFDIGGMHCAACSSRIERVVGQLDGVDKVSVNLATAKAKVWAKPGDDIDEGFLREHGALPVDQALRGAYRLARVLNDLFDN